MDETGAIQIHELLNDAYAAIQTAADSLDYEGDWAEAGHRFSKLRKNLHTFARLMASYVRRNGGLLQRPPPPLAQKADAQARRDMETG